MFDGPNGDQLDANFGSTAVAALSTLFPNARVLNAAAGIVTPAGTVAPQVAGPAPPPGQPATAKSQVGGVVGFASNPWAIGITIAVVGLALYYAMRK